MCSVLFAIFFSKYVELVGQKKKSNVDGVVTLLSPFAQAEKPFIVNWLKLSTVKKSFDSTWQSWKDVKKLLIRSNFQKNYCSLVVDRQQTSLIINLMARGRHFNVMR